MRRIAVLVLTFAFLLSSGLPSVEAASRSGKQKTQKVAKKGKKGKGKKGKGKKGKNRTGGKRGKKNKAA